MRILQLHSNYIEYEAVEKEIELAEEPEKLRDRLEEVVVLFTAIEDGDDKNIAMKAMEATKKSLDQLKVNRILVYPYAHLSSNLAKPSDALKILKEMREIAKTKGLETYSTPFGWCKKFSISIKGHPLAEHLRIVTSEAAK
ncbi:MAG TPA: threonyl-tRNA synthetase editing domain-containing protein, partial [Acidobacteriota bacterium]|nr:threonyl-tRNA synthetase editing domain-containing protein [Acidobacteriota bacterium]